MIGEAVGMSGKAMFSFELVFYEPVQSDVSESWSHSSIGLVWSVVDRMNGYKSNLWVDP